MLEARLRRRTSAILPPMEFDVNRILKLEDFEQPDVRAAIRDILANEAATSPGFPTGREHRKQWEMAMAVLALDAGGALRPDAEVLGIGAGMEATLFWLTNRVRRVWATDLYAEPGRWNNTAPPTMLIDPGSAWDGAWNPRRLVVQHMDACDLAYEDASFDGIFSSSSIEHFGSVARINAALDEAFRVLKQGGIASFSTEFLIEGDPFFREEETIMFSPELLEDVLVGGRDWTLITPIDFTLSEATRRTEVELSQYLSGQTSEFPHCVLRMGPNLFTSVHVALRKSGQPGGFWLGAARALTSRQQQEPVASRPEPAIPDASPEQQRNRPDKLPRMSTDPESPLKRRARRVAQPILSPIDGRVGDINRRIEFTRTVAERRAAMVEERVDSVARALDTYIYSSAETSSYVGFELRRLSDAIEGFHTTLQHRLEEYYERRLAHSEHLPLQELDEPLANAINWAASHRGFSAQAGLWFNQPVNVNLGVGSAWIASVNERIVEVPFSMAALGRLEPGARILDIGSAESTFPLAAAALGYQVTAIDPRPLGYEHPNLESHAVRFEMWQGSPGTFDAAFLISTIEHVGVGAYGQGSDANVEPGASADLAMLDRIQALLKPDGVMILTTPYGAREVTELERVYDDESLDKLLAAWEIVDRRVVVRRDELVWEPAENVERGGRGVAMLIASPKRPSD